MPQAIINYKSQKTLDALLGISKFFDFSIVDSENGKEKKKKEVHEINGVTFTPGDASINTDSMKEIFTRSNFDAKELRKKAWQRKK